MVRQEVSLEDPGRIVIQLEHRDVELQDVLRANLGGTRGLGSDDQVRRATRKRCPSR